MPPSIREQLVAIKADADLGNPVFDQLALAAFIERGRLDRSVRRNRGLYRRRRDALVRGLHRDLPEFSVRGIAAGLHAYVTLPRGLEEGAVEESARRHSVGVYGAGRCYLDPPDRPALVLGYASLSERAVDQGTRRLAAAIRTLRPAPVPRRRGSPALRS